MHWSGYRGFSQGSSARVSAEDQGGARSASVPRDYAREGSTGGLPKGTRHSGSATEPSSR
jgi:hypothetical protein